MKLEMELDELKRPHRDHCGFCTPREATVNAIREAGLDGSVKVMVGGAPVTAEYAQQIGADGYAADASQAVTTAKLLIA